MALPPNQALSRAMSLWQSGQKTEARAALEALVAAHPGFVDARITLGRALRDAGENPAALAQFRRAAEASGGHPQAWGIYITALVEDGKKARARKAAQTAPVKGPVRKELLALATGQGASAPDPAGELLGDVAHLVHAGDLEAARQKADEGLAAAPKSLGLLNLRAVIALQQDDPLEAEPFLHRALAIDPKNVDVLANLGLSLLRQGRPMAAVGLLSPWSEDPSASPALKANLASALVKSELAERGLDLVETLLAEAPEDADLLAIKAEALIEVEGFGAAITLLDGMKDQDGFALPDLLARALERGQGREAADTYLADIGPQPEDVELRLANAQAEWGDVEGAAKRARAVAEAQPDDPQGVRALGLFAKWQPEDLLIGKMRAMASDQATTPSVRGRFGMALGKALMDVGDHDGAFDVLAAANAELRKGVLYDADVNSEEFRNIVKFWDAKTIDRLSHAGDESVAPIFIIGLPRSGSTLIENVLSRHPEVMALGEWPVCGSLADAHRSRANASAIRKLASDVTPLYAEKAKGRSRVTDKLLSNFMGAGMLAATFPKARFIEAGRDLRATCLSIFQNPLNPGGHPYSMDLTELGQMAVDYAELMDHWEQVLGPRFQRCSYENLVSDPEPNIRALLDGLDLPFHEDCLTPEQSDRRVNTLSVAQVRKPLHTGSTERWRRYESGLAPLLEILEKHGR